MKRKEVSVVIAALFGGVLSHSALAEPVDHQLHPMPPNLSAEQSIYDLRGQIWPIIVGITTIDIALQSYFWGVYIPAIEEDEDEYDEIPGGMMAKLESF